MHARTASFPIFEIGSIKRSTLEIMAVRALFRGVPCEFKVVSFTMLLSPHPFRTLGSHLRSAPLGSDMVGARAACVRLVWPRACSRARSMPY